MGEDDDDDEEEEAVYRYLCEGSLRISAVGRGLGFGEVFNLRRMVDECECNGSSRMMPQFV